MASNKPPVLSAAEIDELLSMTLIANLATLDSDGGIHLLSYQCGSCESVTISVSQAQPTRTNIGISRLNRVLL
jgi:hypothetical protein